MPAVAFPELGRVFNTNPNLNGSATAGANLFRLGNKMADALKRAAVGRCGTFVLRNLTARVLAESSYLVDSASSHMLVSKIKPCMSKYKQIYTVKLRMAH